VWYPIHYISFVSGIAEKTLADWCEAKKVPCRMRKKVWEINISSIVRVNRPITTEIDELFYEAARVPNRPLPSTVDGDGTRKR
jgi:hypothetical protein